MTPEQAIADIQAGRILPVYLLVGEERVFIDRVVQAIRVAAVDPSTADFNVETFTAVEAGIDRVMSSSRMVPMMASRRVVIVRGVDKWEPSAGESKSGTKSAGKSATKKAAKSTAKTSTKASGKIASKDPLTPMERLTAYVESPIDSTVLVLIATKLDKRRKLMSHGMKAGYVVSCDPVSARALPRFVMQEARDRGHTISQSVAERIAQMTGPGLAEVIDAVERLSLFVGQGASITHEAVADCVTQLRAETVWSMVDAVSKRDAAAALAILNDVFDPQDRGLRLVALLAWSTRQLLRFSLAYKKGVSAEQAAAQAGVPPFKARDMAQQVRQLQTSQIESWLSILAQTDIALKSSRRPARAIVESAIMTMTMA